MIHSHEQTSSLYSPGAVVVVVVGCVVVVTGLLFCPITRFIPIATTRILANFEIELVSKIKVKGF